MARAYSTDYDLQVSELAERRKHPVARRIIGAMVQRGSPHSAILGVLDFVSAIFAACEKRRTHGHLALEHVTGLRPKRTLDRYMSLLLDLDDGEGGKDFYLVGGTLFVPHFRHSVADMKRAEAGWERTRQRRAEAQRKRRLAARCQTTPNTMAPTPTSEPFCEVKPSDSSLREENPQDKDTAWAELCALGERMEQAEAVGVGCEQPQETEAELRARLSLERTEAAARELEAERARSPVQPVAKAPPLRGQLTQWGYRPEWAARHRFTEHELAMAVEKIEAARTPLQNRAGAVVATILRWRTGQWQVAA
jgi:hypothetical protein